MCVYALRGMKFRPGNHLTPPAFFGIFWAGVRFSPFISRRIPSPFCHPLSGAGREVLSGHPSMGADELKVGGLE